ncbi:DUF262 domain-containing protein [Acidaminococcus fermentans]|uniref:DUF262 domain-containing protein n=1 Tax=Acidaminococcus fermentans TaxID=905 RepID=UPI003F88B26F
MDALDLQSEIDKMRKQIKTDNYLMSIGEIANLYRDGDLNISPIYQRLFRWDIFQQSALIESILLGIPIPPIYVYQDSEGRWNLIDGLQRLSTIFKFMGILKENAEPVDGNEDNTTKPEPLVKTKFLKALANKMWKSKDEKNSFTEVQRRLVKRAKLSIIIIDQSSDDFAEYEMFQRLNTGGSHLSSQEIRNCVLIVKNENVYKTLKHLSETKDFQQTLPISEKEEKEQGYIELVVKYFVLKYASFSTVSDSENYNVVITNEILHIINDHHLDSEEDKEIFHRVFSLLNNVLGEDSFKRYDSQKKKHSGTVLVGAYEAIISGLTRNVDYYENHKEKLQEKINNLYDQEEYCKANKRGTRPVARMKQLFEFGRKYFQENEN